MRKFAVEGGPDTAAHELDGAGGRKVALFEQVLDSRHPAPAGAERLLA
jgi:hypothetical protein